MTRHCTLGLATSLAIAGLFTLPIAALAQPTSQSPADAALMPSSPQPPSDQDGSPDEAPMGTELPALYVTTVEVIHSATDESFAVVRATGVTSTPGWGPAELVPTFDGLPADGILDFELIAPRPDHSQIATGFQSVTAILPVDADKRIRGVRVRASENALTVNTIPGSATHVLSVQDCHDCVGKRFMQAGQVTLGETGIIRREELPKALRVLRPEDGIRGNGTDGNRLTIVLGDGDVIVKAFWE